MATPIVRANATPAAVTIAPRLPFDAPAVRRLWAAHEVPGAELSSETGLTRLVATPAGSVLVTVEPRAEAVSGLIYSTDDQQVQEVATLLRWWLDLDTDPSLVVAALGDDPTVGSYVRERPGLRVVKTPDGFEAAVLTVIGQQVSVGAMRTFAGRLVGAFGSPHPSGCREFPTPTRLAGVSPDVLQRTVGLTGARTRTVLGVARAFAGGLALGRGTDWPAARSELLAIPGIGPWTTDYLAVRAIGDPDAFVPGDLVLQRVLGVGSARAAEAVAEAWRPYRAYALAHLWQGSYERPSPVRRTP